MKKFLMFIVVVLLLALIGAGVFLATFDADRYRPMAVKQIEAALGVPVSLEHLSLTWKQGIALRADRLRIQDPTSRSGEPLAEVARASALVRVGPLLRKRLEIASVILERPVIRLVKSAQGGVNAAGLAPVAAPAAAAQTASAPAGGAAPGVALDIARVEIRDGDVRYTDGTLTPAYEVHLTRVGVTLTGIAAGKPVSVQAQAALGADLPNVRVRARVRVPDASGPGNAEDLSIEIADLPLELVLPKGPAQDPALRGRLTATFNGVITDLGADRIAESVTGQGMVDLQQGVLLNVNVLRQVLEQLEMIPGLVDKLRSELPPEYLAKLESKDTPLAPLSLTAAFDRGGIRFDVLKAGTDTLDLSGSGRANLQGGVEARALLQVSAVLSDAMFRSVKELKLLSNDNGEIEFPVIISRASWSSPMAFQPDLQYIGQKLITTKGVELLSDLLRRTLRSEPEVGAAAPPAVQPEGQTPTSEAPEPTRAERNAELLGQVLRRVLVPEDSAAPAEPATAH